MRGKSFYLLSYLQMGAVLCAASFYLLQSSAAVAQSIQSEDVIPLSIETEASVNTTIKQTGDGEFEIAVTGARPMLELVMHKPINPILQAVVSFAYFSSHTTGNVIVEFGESAETLHRVNSEGLSHAEAFTQFSVNLRRSPAWQGNIRILRVRFEAERGQVIRLRNLVLRPETAKEREEVEQKIAARNQDTKLATHLRQYLSSAFASKIDSVIVGDRFVHIEGEIAQSDGQLYLAEVPLYEDTTELRTFDYCTPIQTDNGHFRIDLTRFRTLPEGHSDRLLAKWVLVQKTSDGYKLMSHAHYADEEIAQYNLPDDRPLTKKGLGGVSIDRPIEDLDALGITSMTINIFLDFMRSSATPDTVPIHYNGKTYYVDLKKINVYDRTLQYAAKRKIIVAAIVLVPQARNLTDSAMGKLLAYPGADPAGVYAMPNLTSPEGMNAYAAALDFLASRYSRPDEKYGRIHHWIMHNEVDAGWVWTNAGAKSEITFFDLYHRSMRIMYLIARQYNPHAKVFISLTHFWNWTEDPHFYLPRNLLTDLVDYSHAEGDFEWAIAYHPYPESLFNPRTWEDKKVSYSLDTPLITFKNIEVLDEWTKQAATFFRGIKRRTIYLSEQGFNSPDYSSKSLTDQAAALAYAWKKIENLDSIEAMQYHNWVDNREEGGLRIGLRRFPDDQDQPNGKKPIWHLYQKLGTLSEDAACAFALPVIGTNYWSQIQYKGPIARFQKVSTNPLGIGSDTWVGTDALGRSLPTYTQVGPPKPGRYVGIFYFLTHESPGKPGPLDVTKVLAQNPDTSKWKPGTYYWGEPEAGYYLSTDPWVIRRHAELLSDAGVDVIIFDTTNNITFPAVYTAIARIYMEMRAEGERTPQIAFLASRDSIQQLWDSFYSKGLYKDLWFQWKGKPLLMEGQQIGMQHAGQFPDTIKNFFTIRESWAWDSLPWYRDGHNQWPWVTHTPQVYGWSESPDRPEMVPVAVAEHPLSAIGRSFHNGHEPATNKYDLTAMTSEGKFFQEQWDRAIALDPEFIFVTGWNEWTAGSMRMGNNVQNDLAKWDFYPGADLSRAGHALKPGDLYFIDQYNQEFSRDVEPMAGGHTDNYYYQLVANIRRYKGAHPPQPASIPITVDLNGSFSQWSGVTPEYYDHSFDTLHRDSSGNDQAGPYIDKTGRNDILLSKVVRDKNNLYFYAKTREPITSANGKNWMLLFLDTDENSKTGWNGYDYVINVHVVNDSTTTLDRYTAQGRWEDPIRISYRVSGNELMIAVPRRAIHQEGEHVGIDFHWADNIGQLNNITEFFLHGDSAPERRFNYRYEASDQQ